MSPDLRLTQVKKRESRVLVIRNLGREFLAKTRLALFANF